MNILKKITKNYRFLRLLRIYSRARLLIWDLDGTLYFNPKLIEILRKRYLRYYIRLNKDKGSKKMFEKKENLGFDWNQIIETVSNLSKKELILLIERGIKKERFIKNNRLIVNYFTRNSKKNLLFTNCTTKQSLLILNKIGLKQPLEIFNNIISLDNFNEAKPSSNSFKVLVKHLRRYKAEQIIYIGDSLNQDILPANKRGFQTIFINHWGKQELGKFNYKEINNLFTDLLHLVKITKIKPISYFLDFLQERLPHF